MEGRHITIENGEVYDCADVIRELSIPEGVRGIGDNAFYKCGKLERVRIPDSVVRIGSCAFKYCDHLEHVRMPVRLEDMGAEVFEYCWNLREIVVPEGVTSIGESTFEGCTRLERIVLPASISRVPRAAFASCRHLRRIEIDMKKLEILPYSARNYAVLGWITVHTYDTAGDGGAQQAIVNEYIRKHNVSFFDIVLSSDSKAAVNYILSNELLDPDLTGRFIAESSEQKRSEITAMLLDYRNRLGLTGKESEEEWDPFL